MKNHGFASKSNFRVVSKSDSKVVFILESNPETLQMYPFKFKLSVMYSLERNKLIIKNTVENTDAKEIFFSIGAHPGFNIPFKEGGKFNDYYLEFENIETANRLPLTEKEGLLSSRQINNYLDNTRRLDLDYEMFQKRAIILEGISSSTVTIKGDYSSMAVRIGIKDFPFLGIWTTSKTDAPFLCIEPWYGISDDINSSGYFKKKKGIQSLKVGNSLKIYYFIEIINH
jgi:galactose mutarotase-like enzyme